MELFVAILRKSASAFFSERSVIDCLSGSTQLALWKQGGLSSDLRNQQQTFLDLQASNQELPMEIKRRSF